MSKAKTLAQLREEAVSKLPDYQLHYWRGWNYSCLKHIRSEGRKHQQVWESYSDAIIMADTETSKEHRNEIRDAKYIPVENHIVAWSIAIRAYGHNIVTLYGHKPSSFVKCLKLISSNLYASNCMVYFHNLAYDWIFLRKFLLDEFGEPDKQLNVKSHYPIVIQWKTAGIILKDSLILAQRSLDRWAKDLHVEHQKALGAWDYEKIRTQDEHFNDDELLYIQNDVLAGVECIEQTMHLLGKSLLTLPFTATGVPRTELRKKGKSEAAHQLFLAQVNDLHVQEILEQVFHGGYVHANRHLLNTTLSIDLLGGMIQCYDFASSYPFCMIAFKYPVSKFYPLSNCSIEEILGKSDRFCFIFKLVMVQPILKDYDYPMPALQFSKCVKVVNPICDNGRILYADYVEIYLNEVDLEVINKLYRFKKHICTDVYYAEKGRLPTFLVQYVFDLFRNKCSLKNVDDLLYTLSKYTLNSCYGMCVQKPLKQTINEDYETGEHIQEEWSDQKYHDEYEKYKQKRGSILNFAWGCYVTSYATRNLFKLGKCCNIWIYSDTDSVYGAIWDVEKVRSYNEWCKDLIREAGFGPVIRDSKEYWLGIAEHEDLKDDYTEFRTQGAKRYCGRNVKDGKLHITVAGVPKCGVDELQDDIDQFKPKLIFQGIHTGKKTHTYFFTDSIKIKNGIEYGDSIDLTPCDYELDGVIDVPSWYDIINETTDLPTYGNDYIYDYGGTNEIKEI